MSGPEPGLIAFKEWGDLIVSTMEDGPLADQKQQRDQNLSANKVLSRNGFRGSRRETRIQRR
jgi:hypothetical protein